MLVDGESSSQLPGRLNLRGFRKTIAAAPALFQIMVPGTIFSSQNFHTS